MRNIFSILFIAAILLIAASCNDQDFTSKYNDPSKTTTVTCPRLMTGVFYAGREYTFNSYWRIFTWDYSAMGRYSQTLGFQNTEGRYQFSDGYYSDRWNNFYNVLAQYRELDATYNKLDDVNKAVNQVFVLTARVFMYDHLTQVADCWGDIPFSKAGFLPVSGTSSDAMPIYDTAESIYSSMLDDLASINTLLKNISLSSEVLSTLKTQDYINNGDLMLWRKYCNSLRLRIATEVADNGSLNAKAQAAIKEMLSDPTTFPMVESNAENIHVTPDTDGFNYGEQYKNGWETWAGELNRASKAMVDALQGDARMEVLFDKNYQGNYVGVDTHIDYATQFKLFYPSDPKQIYYCAYDTATFSRNQKLPGIIISAAEVAFNKANAYNKGYATGDAKAGFVNGIKLSTEFYYQLNSTGIYRNPVAPPATADVQNFASAKWDAATNKDEVISTQLWLNFGFLQTTQAWTTVRRTGYPVLYFATDNSSLTVPNVPVRLRYPPSERNLNAVNYNAYKSKDNFTTKMFWAK
jgi:hypothetical protein